MEREKQVSAIRREFEDDARVDSTSGAVVAPAVDDAVAQEVAEDAVVLDG